MEITFTSIKKVNRKNSLNRIKTIKICLIKKILGRIKKLQ